MIYNIPAESVLYMEKDAVKEIILDVYADTGKAAKTEQKVMPEDEAST